MTHRQLPLGDSTAESLLAAQTRALDLFRTVKDRGMICAGKLESELSREIHALAKEEFGLRRHWHRRIVRAGPNTVRSFSECTQDRRIAEDDVVYLDLGPVFGEWEADVGRSYAVGADPDKQRVVADIEAAFAEGKRFFGATPDLSAGELYDFVNGLAGRNGWEFGASTAGHLVGHFPHERPAQNRKRFSIRHGNPQRLREPDEQGCARHWILEIHFVDRRREFGGFHEELLTI
jgi:Xaa-Pro dipeptidase